MKEHNGFSVIECGFCLNPDYPFLRATPDFRAYCTCHGSGVGELKSSLTKKVQMIEKACLDKTFTLIKSETGLIYLKRNHQDFYQVQAHMFLTYIEYCDFIFWTLKDLHYERLL